MKVIERVSAAAATWCVVGLILLAMGNMGLCFGPSEYRRIYATYGNLTFDETACIDPETHLVVPDADLPSMNPLIIGAIVCFSIAFVFLLAVLYHGCGIGGICATSTSTPAVCSREENSEEVAFQV